MDYYRSPSPAMTMTSTASRTPSSLNLVRRFSSSKPNMVINNNPVSVPAFIPAAPTSPVSPVPYRPLQGLTRGSRPPTSGPQSRANTPPRRAGSADFSGLMSSVKRSFSFSAKKEPSQNSSGVSPSRVRTGGSRTDAVCVCSIMGQPRQNGSTDPGMTRRVGFKLAC